MASKVDNDALNIAFTPTPDYAGIAKAAAGGNLWADYASTTKDLERLLPEAVKAVMNGTGAVLDAQLDGANGKFGEGKLKGAEVKGGESMEMEGQYGG